VFKSSLSWLEDGDDLEIETAQPNILSAEPEETTEGEDMQIDEEGRPRFAPATISVGCIWVYQRSNHPSQLYSEQKPGKCQYHLTV
jgi:hypothetical protein